MAEVVIYTKPGCPYCTAAMALLKRKGVDFTEIVASRDPEMIYHSCVRERSGQAPSKSLYQQPGWGGK